MKEYAAQSSHELAKKLGVSDYSIDHARQDLGIHRHGELLPEEVERIVRYKHTRDAEYEAKGILDEAPIGFYMTSHDISRFAGSISQNHAVKLMLSGKIKAYRVKNGNGYQYLASPASVYEYCVRRNIDIAFNHLAVVEEARRRDFRNVIADNPCFREFMVSSGLGFYEALDKLIEKGVTA